MASDNRTKLDASNPFAKRPSMFDLTDNMAQEDDDNLRIEPQVIERVVEIEKVVEVAYPVTTDADGVTWVGNIGMSQTGLVIPQDITNDEWVAFYSVISNVKQSIQFIIGDWFAYGADKFKHSYAQIAEATGYKESTVETFASVCRNVPRLTRVNSLGFSHHRVVSTLAPNRQIEALNHAVENQLSARDLQQYLTEKKSRKSGVKKAVKIVYNVIDKKEFNRAKKADENERRKLAEQLRAMAEQLERGE